MISTLCQLSYWMAFILILAHLKRSQMGSIGFSISQRTFRAIEKVLICVAIS